MNKITLCSLCCSARTDVEREYAVQDYFFSQRRRESGGCS
jgi:hypothetical protein